MDDFASDWAALGVRLASPQEVPVELDADFTMNVANIHGVELASTLPVNLRFSLQRIECDVEFKILKAGTVAQYHLYHKGTKWLQRRMETVKVMEHDNLRVRARLEFNFVNETAPRMQIG